LEKTKSDRIMKIDQKTHDYLQSIRKQRNFGKDQIKILYQVYNLLTNSADRPSTCGSCLSKRHAKLMEILSKAEVIIEAVEDVAPIVEEVVEVVKKRRGRPKGSKNKSKTNDDEQGAENE